MQRDAAHVIAAVLVALVAATSLVSAAPDDPAGGPPADTPPEVRKAIEALRSGNYAAKRDAIAALTQMGPGAAAAVPYLVPLSNDYGGLNSEPARDALQAIGEAAVPALIEALVDPETERPGAMHAAQALAGMSDAEGQQALRDIMLDQGREFTPRLYAVQALGEVKDEASIPALAQVLKTEPRLSRSTGEALAAMGQPGVDAMVGVMVADDVDDETRASAARGILKAKDCDVVTPLGQVLSGANSPGARLAAIEALTKLGDERIPGLLGRALSDDGKASVRAAAAKALRRFEGRVVTQMLLDALVGDQDLEVRKEAAQVLCDELHLRVTADDTPSLAHVLDSESNRQIRDLVAGALEEVGDRRAVEALCRAAVRIEGEWMDPDRSILRALTRLGDGRCVRWLVAKAQSVAGLEGRTNEMGRPARLASDALEACTGEQPWTATPEEERDDWQAWFPWWEQNKSVAGEERAFVFTYEVGSEDKPPTTARRPRRGSGIVGTLEREVKDAIDGDEETPGTENDDSAAGTVRARIAIRPVAQLDTDEPKIVFEVGEPEFLEPLPELSAAQRGMLNIELGMMVDKLNSDVCHIPLPKDDVGDLLGRKRTVTKTVPYESLRAVLWKSSDLEFSLTRPPFTGAAPAKPDGGGGG